MKTTDVKVPADIYHRYLPVEGDGSTLLAGYAQRPHALKSASSVGLGVYDAREKELILEPDTQKRLDHHRKLLKDERRELTEHEELFNRLTIAAAREQTVGTK